MSYTPPDPARWARSRAHQAAMHRLVPGGAHTYARGDDQMPEAMPVVIARGHGCRVEDVDGNRYIEYGMGLRAVTLGHAEPRVTAAAAEWLARGVGFSRPASIEREAAEAFLDLIPGAERVKFCKDGSSATTAAVKLARAATGRDTVAVCHEHPFLSQDDWFIGTTDMDAGIPQAVRDLTVAFPYGDLDALAAVLDAQPRSGTGAVACVVMEATRGAGDPAAYLHAAQALCRARGAVFVLDEMITGFRWHARGAQGLYGLTPDLSTFGKALANGFSVSALAGRADLMDLGGMTTDRDRVFLLSSTHGAETHALAAAVAAMTITRDDDPVGVMDRAGARLRRGAEQAIAAAGVSGFVGVAGRDSNLVFTTADAAGRPSQPYRTLMLQELTRRGILGPSFVVSAAHDDAAVDETVDAFAAACRVYRDALDAGSVEPFGVGRPVQPAIRRASGTVWTSPAPAKSAPANPASPTSARAPSSTTSGAFPIHSHTPSS